MMKSEIRLKFCGQKMTNAEWLSVAGLLFGRQVYVPSEGDVYLLDQAKPFRFGCPHCQLAFESALAPTTCPHCGMVPGEKGIEVTHKGFTETTFPFV
jgi:hypothetical protein